MTTTRPLPKTTRYAKLVEWSDDDQSIFGSAPPLIGPGCHGKDGQKVYREPCTIVDEE